MFGSYEGIFEVVLIRFTVKQILGIKKLGSQKNGYRKILGQKEFWSEKIKVRSGATELFMIWTKVVRTNIACTNVTVTFEIC